jgi:hypothetical protein
MNFSLDEVDLGFVVNLETLRDISKAMSVNGRKWWIASDPGDAHRQYNAAGTIFRRSFLGTSCPGKIEVE